MALSRRGFLAGLAGTVGAAALDGCSHPTNPRALRLGYFPNLTHAPAILGVTSGRFASALGGVSLETHAFNAGPEAMGALLAGALDMLYVGPVPAVTGYVRTHGQGVTLVAGVASGGSMFVVRGDAPRERAIVCPADLRDKHIATPQLGNSQDLALRSYLQRNGLGAREWGGEVDVTPMRNALILQQFRRGLLDGAWVPEPWGSRLVREARARVFIDERDLWPGGRFAATVLVARTRYLREARGNVVKLVAAHAREVAQLVAAGPGARVAVGRGLAQVGPPVPDALLQMAFPRVSFTTDPLFHTVTPLCQSGQALGLLPQGEVTGMNDPSVLAEAGV